MDMRNTEAAAGMASGEPSLHVPHRIFFKLVDRALDLSGTQALANIGAVQPQGFYLNRARRIGSEYKGGIYAGISLHEEQACELILLPGDEKLTWKAALEWAEKQGGALPSRMDQLVLFKNLKREFKEDYYWSSEQHAGNGDYAWCQYFGYGFQGYYREDFTCRARAVRRLPIQ
jgi:hypothetical protein